MSFMPSPGSIVRSSLPVHGSTHIGIVTKVTPDGKGDRVLWLYPAILGGPLEERVSPGDIYEVIHEVDGR